MELKLIVIRTGALKAVAEFYTLLGLSFDYHQHGKGPYHYAATSGDMTLEIYPLAKDQMQADAYLRLGFRLDHFEEVIERLRLKNVPFLSDPAASAFGYKAVVADPDGRKVELYQ